MGRKDQCEIGVVTFNPLVLIGIYFPVVCPGTFAQASHFFRY